MNKISEHIFRAYDIRGLYGKDIDPTVFYQIGLAAGAYLKKKLNGSMMTVGNDIRQSSYPLVYSFIAGVSATGVQISFQGRTSFGQTLFAGWQQKSDLIAFVTASHLPPEWNGVKFYYGDGVGLPEKELMHIRDIVLKQQWTIVPYNDAGTVTKQHLQHEYIDYFTKHFTYKHKMKVALDCGGASMTLSAPAVFSALKIDTVPIFCKPDPTFSNRPSDPKPVNLKMLMKKVVDEKCDFGVAFDGDGDRSVIVDDTGSVLSSDETGILLGKYGLGQRTGTIIANVECSKAVAEQLSPLGFKIKQIQVGHTFLTLHAKQEHALLGIESSGHFILPSYFLFDDAIIVPLKIAEILDHQQKPLHVLRETIPIYPLKKEEIDCDDAIKFDVINHLKAVLTNEFSDVNTLDGIRINLENGWVLIRASNTSPLIRLTAEADTNKEVDHIAKDFTKRTETVIKEYKEKQMMQIS